MRARAFILGILLFLTAPMMFANQFFTEFYTIHDVLKMGHLFYGTVIAINLKNHTVTVLIEKILSRSLKDNLLSVTYSEKEETEIGWSFTQYQKKICPGDIVEFHIYQGIEWEYEDESPIDIRLENYKTLESFTKGDLILLASQDGFIGELEIADLDSISIPELEQIIRKDIYQSDSQ